MAMTPAQFAKTVSVQFFQPAFREGQDTEIWPMGDVTTFKDSKRALEQVFSYTGLGAAQASDVSGTVNYLDMSELGSYTWTHATFTSGAICPQQLIEDSQYIEFAKEIGWGIGQGFNYTKYKLGTLPFDRAFDSNYPTFDGVEMCGTHVMDIGDTVVNKLDPLSLNWANAWDGVLYFEQGMVDQRGIPLVGIPEGILFHTSLLKEARKVVEGVVQPDIMAPGNPNTLKKYNLKLTPNRMLADTAAWFVYDQTFSRDNIFWTRIAPKTDDDAEFDKYGIKFRSRARWSNGARQGIHIVGFPSS
jgi:hypothetical protein